MFYLLRISINLIVTMVLLQNIASAEGNASNPMAAVNNVDLRWQGTFVSADDRNDYFVNGAQMLRPDVKLVYELHYNSNDFTGSTQHNFEKLVIRPLWFPYQAKLNDTWGMKVAVGFDWIVDLGDSSKAIGAGADQIAPLGGIAFSNFSSGLILIPFVQHFASYNGSTDISTTAGRLIILKPFGKGYWTKADIKVPYDWENEKWPITAEVQVGYNASKSVAVYGEGLVGIGHNRPYDVGVGVGLRFKY